MKLHGKNFDPLQPASSQTLLQLSYTISGHFVPIFEHCRHKQALVTVTWVLSKMWLVLTGNIPSYYLTREVSSKLNLLVKQTHLTKCKRLLNALRYFVHFWASFSFTRSRNLQLQSWLLVKKSQTSVLKMETERSVIQPMPHDANTRESQKRH